jgi:hypothetical protein
MNYRAKFRWSGTPLIVFGLLILAPDGTCAGETQDTRSLARKVVERERQLMRSQRELAEARAQLAVAEGRREAAIAEYRKAVAGYQAEEGWVRSHASWFCDPREPMDEVQWGLAESRAALAEVEGDRAALVEACRKIVGFDEKRLAKMQRLEQLGAAHPADVQIARDCLETARERLKAAESK